MDTLADVFRDALYEELDLNEGLLTTENGLDFTCQGVASKQHPISLVALMKQATVLCGTLTGNAEEDLMLATMLDWTLETIDAMDHCMKTRSESMTNAGDIIKRLVDDLPPVTKEVGAFIKSADDFYQSILQGNGNRGKENAPLTQAKGIPSTSIPAKNPIMSETSVIDSKEDGDGKKKMEFVTAGQMIGRPPPSSSANKPPAAGQPSVARRPVGLSKRIKPSSTPATPMAVGGNDPPAQQDDSDIDPRLRGIDPKLLETIKNEIIHSVDAVSWDQIAGLEHAKNTIKEIVIWPMLRPDIFTGLRGPPKGLLLFGPPGTGKTMIGKCIASQAKATFFSISASSLTSKWVGEGEKLVRALFACARALQPSVVFIDEIDSLLTQRTDGEFEASRRIKTEFLVQFDGASTSSSDRILVIGATNRPQELDEAARRRLVKRLYIPLPDQNARSTIVRSLLSSQRHSLSPEDIDAISMKTDGYSGADVDNLCREAALGPIRSITNILEVSVDQVRPIDINDFYRAMSQVRASVSSADLAFYLDWNEKFGSLSL